jgi:hypothetical protein
VLPSRDTIVAGAASRICRRKPLSADVNETVRAVSSCSNSVRSRITLADMLGGMSELEADAFAMPAGCRTRSP